MPKLTVSMDDVVIKEVQLTKDRTVLGRRPYNDIVLDNLAVSGEHAVFQMSGNDVHLEDLSSTNGTYVNGTTVKKLLLLNQDTIDIGRYKIKYTNDAADDPPAMAEPNAIIKLMSGPGAGRQVPLVKVVTTIGKPGVAVAAITKRGLGFVITHAEGAQPLSLNGAVIGAEPVALKDGDLLELAGTQMQFVQL
jgi:hypothetical protein